jgi:predicted hydrocarbon binding protein
VAILGIIKQIKKMTKNTFLKVNHKKIEKKIKKIKINDYKDKLIELEEEGKVIYEIGYRGGNYGLSVERAIELLEIKERWTDFLLAKVGVYCNYLGGGLRGAIVGGGYGKEIPEKDAKKIENFYKACKERYLEIENGLNDEEDENGETNWDAIGTNRSREAGIISAY